MQPTEHPFTAHRAEVIEKMAGPRPCSRHDRCGIGDALNQHHMWASTVVMLDPGT